MALGWLAESSAWMSFLKDLNRISTKNLRENMAEAVNYVKSLRGRVIVTRNSIDEVGIVSIRDVAILEALSKHQAVFEELCKAEPALAPSSRR